MYRLLIADDEPIELAVLSRKIQKFYPNQIEIFLAKNGREAIELAEKNEIQIAILDIEMPGINGLVAAEAIRKKKKACCIIFLTAFDDFLYAKKAISVRALDYLLKPSSEKEILAVLDEAIQLVHKGIVDIESKELDPVKIFKENEIEGSNAVKLNIAQKHIAQYIREHYMDDISLQDIAQTMNYSEVYFCKIFKQCFDRNFTSYIAEYRVEKSKKLLEDISINVKSVSELVGYRDSNYFAKVFKRIVGITPTEYRIRAIEDKDENKSE